MLLERKMRYMQKQRKAYVGRDVKGACGVSASETFFFLAPAGELIPNPHMFRFPFHRGNAGRINQLVRRESLTKPVETVRALRPIPNSNDE
jgi:hypothetical protein